MLATIVAHAVWHWMFERAGRLAKFPLPKMDAERGAQMIALLILTGARELLLKRWMGASRLRCKVHR
jgi:hypothetical protein